MSYSKLTYLSTFHNIEHLWESLRRLTIFFTRYSISFLWFTLTSDTWVAFLTLHRIQNMYYNFCIFFLIESQLFCDKINQVLLLNNSLNWKQYNWPTQQNALFTLKRNVKVFFFFPFLRLTMNSFQNKKILNNPWWYCFLTAKL